MIREGAAPPAPPRGPAGRLQIPGALFAVALAIALSVVAVGTAMEVSSRPRFCGSCHVMTPYYESWLTSTHRNIACVDCHIPPGVTAELCKKYEALSMVARYFTGTYGTNPWAEIDDASCLRCHERRLLAGRELFGDVLFDHASHLSGMRRGKTLRCTSCHSQIVQGSHIAVTASTCILCHFKGQTAGAGTARCTLCHVVPDTVIRHETLTFAHADVARYGMECTWCHARPAGSDGAVPKERCLTCHNEAARLAEYDDTDLLHRAHVSEHKVDCLNCHLEIQHVGPPRLEAPAAACGTCHLKGHTPQMNLYTGLGGRGVEPLPSPMFLAGVRCEGCHIAIPGETGDTHRAGEVSCMSCHGPSYRRIFLAWREDLERRTSALADQMRRSAALLGSPATRELEDARFNLELVTSGRGVHNVDYAHALLKRSHQDMNRARAAGRLAALPPPWRDLPYETPCLSCHQGVEERRGLIFGRAFAHAAHVVSATLPCTDCHRTHEEKPEGEVARFGEAGCESCHHRDAGADCLACHAGVRTRKVGTALGEFDHAFHQDEAGLGCADCHDLEPGAPVRLIAARCADCHG